METANEIMKQVVPILMVPINRYLRYLILCTTYMRDMGIKMTELNAAKVDVEEKMRHNISNNLEVPAQVEGWLEAVGNINAKVENVPLDIGSCFNLKIRHRAGRNAFEINEEIDSVMRRYKEINWVDHPIPPGRVDSMKASTSTLPSTEHNDFQSREVTFTKALKALEPNHKSHMIALCGMGGVGKTTMLQRLKKIAKEKKMFKFIIEVVIGEKTDPISIQEVIAYYLSVELSEKNKSVRADKLRREFKAKSDGGKNKFLIILDDVWQTVDLEDIGLSPLPNQGVDFKVLLTSRDRHVCAMMGVEGNSILHVGLLIDSEAKRLFWQFVETSDHELHKIGEDIVRKCCGLPIAIKTMACTLRDKSKDAWKDALSRLENHDIDNVASKVFKTSYDNLQDEETKSTFLLCGLFPEDFNIPTEELVRYGWGLKLFKKVYTIREARTRLNTCIERLIHTNLLLESDDVGCVKMHDLVRAFVLGMYSEVEHASIVNHGNTLEWHADDTDDSCKRLSLTCKSMSEFPKDLKFPNQKILKLMHGDKFLRFPQDFYEGMGKLQVISYDKMKYPLLPSSFQCSTNLRVLYLHECSLRMFDCSCIGNLLNLEVLSFADSGIEWLPSTIGNLKKLRLLDLTNCYGLCIANGVLKKLVKLEELYMTVVDRDRKGISLTEDNCNEMAGPSKNLSALEFEFFQNNAQPRNMLFDNLERFKISVGRSFYGDCIKSRHSYENTLKLVIDKGELLESQMNHLFEKTKVLCLSVGNMNDLSDVEVKYSLFYNLRVLVASECPELKHLFTLGVANTLSKLEHLEVHNCNNMEELIHTGGSVEETVIFPKLKYLSLHGLPKLLGLCRNVNTIELPELVELKLDRMPHFTNIYPKNKLETSSLLKEEVVIPKLETLQIDDMVNLKEIWPCELSRGEKVKLRKIEVTNFDKLVNLFPYNPMYLLHHLEELEVMNCGSIESLFNIDLDCAGAIGEEDSSSLRNIKVENLGKLREVWRIKGADNYRPLVCGFKVVESIRIRRCERFRNVFTPTTSNFDLGALLEMDIWNYRDQQQFSQADCVSWSLCQYSREITVVGCHALSSVIPCYAAGQMQKLQVLRVRFCKGMKEVFENSGCDEGNGGIPRLNNVIMLPSLKILYISICNRLEHIFTFSALKSMRQLEELTIKGCKAMKVIVKEEDEYGEQTTKPSSKEVVVFPHLKSIALLNLPELEGFFLGMNELQWPSLDYVMIIDCPKMLVFAPGGSTAPQLKYIHIGLGKHTLGECGLNFHQTSFPSSCVMPWSFHNLIELHVEWNHDVKKIIPSSELLQLQKLEEIHVKRCNKVEEVFETLEARRNSSIGHGCGFDETSQTTTLVKLPNLTQVELWSLNGMRYIWKSNRWTAFEFPNLTRVCIYDCKRLEHVFTSSMAGSLLQLQALHIISCSQMEEVIVKDADVVEEDKEKESDGKTNEILVLPRLKSLTLTCLPCLKGFSLGKEDFSFPLLDTLFICSCPAITTFTKGNSATPRLKEIQTSFGSFYAREDINSFIKIKQEEFKQDSD